MNKIEEGLSIYTDIFENQQIEISETDMNEIQLKAE
jgi:hypothetical protein